MATTNQILKRRVARGAMLLDAKQPGWAPRIDRERLAIKSGFYCVLGQVYGGYWDGIDAMSITGWRYGFVSAATKQQEADEQFQSLDTLWREAIEARCGGDS